MQELILVRHAEAEHLVSDLTGGWPDSSLTNRGRRQAERLGLGETPWCHRRGSGWAMCPKRLRSVEAGDRVLPQPYRTGDPGSRAL